MYHYYVNLSWRTLESFVQGEHCDYCVHDFAGANGRSAVGMIGHSPYTKVWLQPYNFQSRSFNNHFFCNVELHWCGNVTSILEIMQKHCRPTAFNLYKMSSEWTLLSYTSGNNDDYGLMKIKRWLINLIFFNTCRMSTLKIKLWFEASIKYEYM